MDTSVDELGPVDWLVLEFPGKQPTGEVAPFLKDLIDRGLVRLLDLMVLQKDADGTLIVTELSELDPSELGGIRATEAELAMVLSEQDVLDLAETIEPGSTAAVLVWENLWAAPFGIGSTQGRWPTRRHRTHPHPGGVGRHRGRRRGRSLTCPWQTDVGAGG